MSDSTGETADPPARGPHTSASCRLHVFLARDVPIGVVLRRGPSDWARLSVWHTNTDTFEHGQWLHGRVYERRSDLSPDGSLFVAFIRSGVAGARPGQREDSWIAVSRPPFFTALALWWVGSTWCSGGFFAARESLWVGSPSPIVSQGQLPAWLQIAATLPHADGTRDSTDRNVCHNRFLRDGWNPIDPAMHTCRHPHPHEPPLLQLTDLGYDSRVFGGPHQVKYTIQANPTEAPTMLPDASWADWDHRGRLVLAQHGRLVPWQSPDRRVTLADFNGGSPEPTPAPEWARIWPAATDRRPKG